MKKVVGQGKSVSLSESRVCDLALADLRLILTSRKQAVPAMLKKPLSGIWVSASAKKSRGPCGDTPLVIH